MKKLIIATAVLVFASCTDSAKGRLGALGDQANVKCYSGGQLVFEGQSTGKVSRSKSGQIRFINKGSLEYTEIFADCIVKYPKK